MKMIKKTTLLLTVSLMMSLPLKGSDFVNPDELTAKINHISTTCYAVNKQSESLESSVDSLEPRVELLKSRINENEKTLERLQKISQANLLTGFWEDYLTSPEHISKQSMAMVCYVHRISIENPLSAFWFLTTGGKNGFVQRKANQEEAALMKESLRNAARYFSLQDQKESKIIRQGLKLLTFSYSNNALGFSSVYSKNHIYIFKKMEEEERKIRAMFDSYVDVQ